MLCRACATTVFPTVPLGQKYLRGMLGWGQRGKRLPSPGPMGLLYVFMPGEGEGRGGRKPPCSALGSDREGAAGTTAPTPCLKWQRGSLSLSWESLCSSSPGLRQSLCSVLPFSPAFQSSSPCCSDSLAGNLTLLSTSCGRNFSSHTGHAQCLSGHTVFSYGKPSVTFLPHQQ